VPEEDLSLSAVSPIDGRYHTTTFPLSQYFSEYALYKYRLYAEVKYLLFFLKTVLKRRVDRQVETEILKFISGFNLKEAKKIKKIEEETKHDVKAVEYYLKPVISRLGLDAAEYLHFGLTSEDINSIAYGLALKEALSEIIIPEMEKLLDKVEQLAGIYKETSMPARTHGQIAVPTTMGKELVVFTVRIKKELRNLSEILPEAKLTGAVGNYNALRVAFPLIDWVSVGDRFINSLGLSPNHFTTQILPPDNYVKIFQSLNLINSILIGFNQDMWRYISDDYFKQQIDEKQVGSSTMPHKVNPIDFENSEGNLGIANALLQHLISKLPISRLQRDLSDSTVKRNIGSALAYCLLGYRSCFSGLGKITINVDLLNEKLSNHWEMVTEGVQTVLRSIGNSHAFEDMKKASQGKQLNQEELEEIIRSLPVSIEIKKRLIKLTPHSYIGLASQLVKKALNEDNKK
jgi:adenylosuccinate lyase